MIDITDRINITIRQTKDITYECPKCKLKTTIYDVDLGEYTKHECYKCGEIVKFFVKDW